MIRLSRFAEWIGAAGDRRRRPTDGPVPVGFLHIGKTGGTALRELLSEQLKRTPWCDFRLFDHSVSLADFLDGFPRGMAVFFVRDPASRFASGFNSRLRRGQPRYDVPWTDGEGRAFARFGSPEALARALGAPAGEAKQAAIEAMHAIGHVRQPLSAFLRSAEYLDQNRDRILFVGCQETMTQDVALLRRLLRLDADLALAEGDVAAHRSPPGMETALSPEAAASLREWYRADYEIVAWCRAHRREMGWQASDAEAG